MIADWPHDLRSLGIFLLVTVMLGGGAAWMTGAGMARSWRGFRLCVPALLLVAAVARFLHYALFEEALLTLPGYALDALVALLVGGLGYRLTRVRQMTTQYRWLYLRTGPLSFRPREAAR